MTNYIVTGNQNTSGPGIYLVKATGITITLETWTHWADITKSIIIKDMTGSAAPNITLNAPGIIGGLIDDQTSIVFINPFESLTLNPFLGGNTWILT